MLSLIFMTSREAQSPPKLFNMDAVEAGTYTHTHTHMHTHEHTPAWYKDTHENTHGHKCTCAHTHFFLPQRHCMAGVLLALMMKSACDSAALSGVDALQHGTAMLRKFSVSPHWEHGGFSSILVHHCTLPPLPFTPDHLIFGVSQQHSLCAGWSGKWAGLVWPVCVSFSPVFARGICHGSPQ